MPDGRQRYTDLNEPPYCYYTSAGILPYRIDTRGVVWVLLQTYHHQDRAEYQDWGGKSEVIDTGPLATALRECKEETNQRGIWTHIEKLDSAEFGEPLRCSCRHYLLYPVQIPNTLTYLDTSVYGAEQHPEYHNLSRTVRWFQLNEINMSLLHARLKAMWQSICARLGPASKSEKSPVMC
jgi:8-oxo-dGTP pyrophosphatase MutT (NUDIX family)